MANFLPVSLDGDEIPIGRQPYRSDVDLHQLRTSLADTHTVLRHRDTVLTFPLRRGEGVIGEPATLNAARDTRIATRLLAESLVRLLTGAGGYRLRRRVPPQFVSRRPHNDLLRRASPDRPVDWLRVHPEYRLESRTSGPTGQPGILLGLKSRYEIDANAADLAARGLNLVGRYVLMSNDQAEDFPGQDPVFRRRLAGVVQTVRDGFLTVDTADGLIELATTEAWLEARRDNFDDVLAVALGQQAARAQQRLQREIFQLLGPVGRLERTREIARWLAAQGPLTLADGLSARIGLPAGDSWENVPAESVIRPRRLDDPTFVFDLAGERTARYVDRGLTEFGPYDAEGFTPKTPKISVVVPREYQRRAESFMRDLINGIPGTKTYTQGFVRKYRLADARVRMCPFDGDALDAAAYRRACLDAVAHPDGTDLAFVFVSQDQAHLTGNASPYFVAKSVFMSQGVPVQEFQVENINVPDLSYTLNNVALASYAKLGGTPFVTKVPRRSLARELVIGLGSAHVQSHRMAKPQRFVGITTIFNADGHYLVSNASREADYESYATELLRALGACVTDVKTRNAWQAHDTIRLVFHSFKDLKDAEAQAVKKLVDGLTAEYATVEYAFIHVSEKHDWILTDKSNPGVQVGRETKGRLLPQRGQCVRVGRSEMLVATVGAYDVKTAHQATPQPLLLKLHRESTFTDLDYLAGQVFRFTAMSWRRPFPSAMPVTVQYSELMASLLGNLRQVTNWNSDMIGTRLRDSRWFL